MQKLYAASLLESIEVSVSLRSTKQIIEEITTNISLASFKKLSSFDSKG